MPCPPATSMRQAAGAEDATPESGPWRLTLEIPSYLPSMQHLKKRSVREKLYRAFVTRASSLGSSPDGKLLDNEPLIARILELKKRKAELLGYKSYAEVSLVQKVSDESTCAPGRFRDPLSLSDFNASRPSVP